MRIGVYGDSFASSHTQSRDIAWYNILKKLIPCEDVKSYGISGTSLWYSYKKFLETYQEFDTIVFLVTDPSRYTKTVRDDNEQNRFYCNLTGVEIELKSTNLSQELKRTLENLRGWYISGDDEYNLQMSELMLRDMESKCKNIIFFPCFQNSMTKERIELCKLPNMSLKVKKSTVSFTVNLLDVLTKQAQLLGLDSTTVVNERFERISCHMTEEFNNFFAKVIAKKILNNVWDWSNFDNVKLKNNYNYYFNNDNKEYL